MRRQYIKPLIKPEACQMGFKDLIEWSLDIAHGVNYLHSEAPCKVSILNLKPILMYTVKST